MQITPEIRALADRIAAAFPLESGDGVFKPRVRLPEDLVGRKFGKLTVVAYDRTGKHPMWLCRCDCGSEAKAYSSGLLNGRRVSCGCARGEKQTVHGMYKTRVYRIWEGVVRRCLNPKCSAFPNYGGRGITVCERWRSFENFYADMGAPPAGTSIDRIDNDGPYAPGNCRWATGAEQARNTSRNKRHVVGGESLTVTDIALRCGVSRGAVAGRLARGWPIEKAASTPAGKEASR